MRARSIPLNNILAKEDKRMAEKLEDKIKTYTEAYNKLKGVIDTPAWAALSDDTKETFWDQAIRENKNEVHPFKEGSVWRCKFDKELVIQFIGRHEYSKLHLLDCTKKGYGPKTVADAIDYYVGYNITVSYYKSIKDQSVDSLNPTDYADFLTIFDEITDEVELALLTLQNLEE